MPTTDLRDAEQQHKLCVKHLKSLGYKLVNEHDTQQRWEHRNGWAVVLNPEVTGLHIHVYQDRKHFVQLEQGSLRSLKDWLPTS